ncbi:MAG: Mpo1-like protein [Lysobacteraceae bacterium]
MTTPTTGFASVREVYPFYLGEHSNRTSRRLHVIGSTGVLVILGLVVAQVLSPWWLFAVPVCGYGFAWVGHFFFEHNRPATFKHPFYSLMGDWVMFKDVLTGKIPF